MAFNGSGTFNRLYNWVTDDGNGINIEPSRMDGEDDGFATGLSNCITKDGQTTITANIPFNSKKITGLANGSARTDSIALGQVQDNTYGTLGTLGGSADTYTASPSPSITAYATGMEFNMKVNADNTGASTLNVSAVGAKSIKKYDAAGSKLDVEAGDLQQDQYYKVVYDGTDFVVLGKNPATPDASATVKGIIELLTDAELQTGTDTTRAATAANILSLFGASSQAGDGGYVRLPINISGSFDEIIIQWGYTGLIGGASSSTETFSLTFPNACIAGYCTRISSSGANSFGYSVHSLSTTSLTVQSNGAATAQVYWLAVGY